jgi:hypothetical protein
MMRRGGFDEGEVREGLREVTEMPTGFRIKFFRVQAEMRKDSEQPLH